MGGLGAEVLAVKVLAYAIGPPTQTASDFILLDFRLASFEFDANGPKARLESRSKIHDLVRIGGSS